MKKRISLILAAIMILAVMVPAIPVVAVSNTFNASDANPTISTAADYIAFFKAAFVDKTSDFKGKTITMLEDITLNDTSVANWYAQPDAVKLVGTNDSWIWFLGNFDGGNHTLKGAIVEGTFRSDMVTGLFPYVGDGGSIKNLVVDGFYVCSDNTTEAIGSNGRVGTGGLIGMAYKNVTVDNVTMKNGIVTCVENGKGALGALVGSYKADQWYAGIPNQNLKLTNVKVSKTVQVVAPANSSVYVGGLLGHVNTVCTDGVHVDLTGSSISPAGSIGLGRTLQPFGNFYFDSAGGYIWYFDVNGSSSSVRIDKKETCTDKFNSAVLGTGCYGVEVDNDNTFNSNDENPIISTAEDYVSFFSAVWKDGKDFSGKTITMVEDIVLNDTTTAEWYNNSGVVKFGTSSSAAWFKGTFDGAGHTLTGGVLDATCARWDAATGLFPCVGFGATIKNLTIDGFYVCSTNTASDPSYGSAGVAGLIGHAKANVTVDNVAMRNGIITCAENGKAGLGTIVGAYDGQEANQQLKITNTTVENSVKVIAGNNTVYVGGIIGYVHENYKSQPTTIDLSGSKIQPYGCNDALNPIGSFKAGGDPTPMFSWTLKNTETGYEKMFEMAGGTDYTAAWNEAIIASCCYGKAADPVVDFAGVQTRASDNAVRFVGLIQIPADLADISELGFEVTVGSKTVDVDCTKVYTSIIEEDQLKAAPEGYYYFTFAITGVTAGTTFVVKACATVDGADYSTATSTYTYTA